eukprot:TRINITY_DN34232_c0_g1_i1.p1 TRINITY_DN34232_c0_g1~~TRINITY_DN34232_c0_g1_i1.p1  ORF type:complete len:240 (+),score=51.51 TRINITY_DN34232_c0_g1_i1:51-722(+)
MIELLLSHPLVDIDYKPSFVLAASRTGPMRETEISKLDLSAVQDIDIDQVVNEMEFTQLWKLVLNQSTVKANRYFEQKKETLLRRANELPEEDCRVVVTQGFQGSLWKALHKTITFSIAMKFNQLTRQLLALLSTSERLGVLCSSDDIGLITRILSQDTSIDVNALYQDRPLISHHLSRNNSDIIRYVSNNHEINEDLLSEAERAKLGLIIDKWGFQLREAAG